MEKIRTTILKLMIFQGILLLVGSSCSVIGAITVAGIGVKHYYIIEAAAVGITTFLIGVYITVHAFSEFLQSIHFMKLHDVEWVLREKERLKKKLQSKTELELMRTLEKVSSEKYKPSKIYWRMREILRISPDMVVNSKNEAKRRAIMEFLREVYGWK
ncbi:MAG: hypothetical protein QXI91_00740 [Candidatus Bathyarchaeia archaeon]